MSDRGRLFALRLPITFVESFRTKRGRCIVDDDAGELRITGSWLGFFERYYEGSKLMFAVLVGWFCYVAYWVVTTEQFYRRAFFVGVVALVIGGYAVDYARGYTRTNRVPLDSVMAAIPVEGGPLTVPRIVVIYEGEGGIRRRRITLPSSLLSYTEDELERARRLFRDRGISVGGRR